LAAKSLNMTPKSIAVFCGSQPGRDEIYQEHAKSLGKLIAQQGIRLVYGGGNKGLMGAIANEMMARGGEVVGVIPEVLKGWEHHHEGITELHIVADMHVRKKMMYEMCDAAIILPGGYGTMDEFFEMLTWNTLQIHDKQIVILNTAQYYRPLIVMLEQMHQQQFLYEPVYKRIKIAATPHEALQQLGCTIA
jgi:hypothetical protein